VKSRCRAPSSLPSYPAWLERPGAASKNDQVVLLTPQGCRCCIRCRLFEGTRTLPPSLLPSSLQVARPRRWPNRTHSCCSHLYPRLSSVSIIRTASYQHARLALTPCHETDEADLGDVDEHNVRSYDASGVLFCQCGGLSCYRLQRELRGCLRHNPGTLLGPEGDAFLGHLVRVAWPPLDGILASRNVPCVNEAYISPEAVHWQGRDAAIEWRRLNALDPLEEHDVQGRLRYDRERAANYAAWAQVFLRRGWLRASLPVHDKEAPTPGWHTSIPLLGCDLRGVTSICTAYVG